MFITIVSIFEQSGGPLVAEETDDEFSYLVGLSSFSKKWFVSFFCFVFIVSFQIVVQFVFSSFI